MNVFFADDVDTGSANPQDLILTLPESARFAVQTKSGGLSGVSGAGERQFWLANPETPEGYAYYKAQVAALLGDYPQITTLVVWFRGGGTPWMDLKVAEMPATWQAEYGAAIARTPEAAKYWRSQNMFALGKIVRAFERARRELGAARVRIAAGTWNFAFLPGADLFFPSGVPLIGLDYEVLHNDSKLGKPEHRQTLAGVGAHRPLIPVIWAHHDDGTYVGRPFTPFSDFHTKLTEAKASGFGVIHWTTRPLELFFASHIRQVFEETKNESLRATCEHVGGQAMGEYLFRWITEAPQFGRDTSDRFIDRELTNVAAVVAGCRERQALLGAATDERASYFRGLEEFIATFYQTHEQFQNADALWKKGDLAGARAVMATCHPEPVIEQFARFSSTGGMTRGERGLLVSLNLRWLVYFIRLRQALGMEPVRYNFGATSHDKLAQAPGRFTYYFDADHRVWQTLGAEETGAATFTAPKAGDEIARQGIECATPVTLTLRPIVHPAPLPAGQYRLRLLAADPTSTAAGQRLFEVQVKASAAAGAATRYAFAPTRAKFLRLLCRGNSANNWSSIVEIASPALAGGATASAAMAKFEAAQAIDGRTGTRWAAQGENVWIQFPLKSDAALAELDVTWFEGDKRQYRVDFLVSDDGQEWRKLEPRSAPVAAAAPVTERVDLFARAGGANRLVELSFPIHLRAPGVVEVRLVPVTGKALLCAAVLEP